MADERPPGRPPETDAWRAEVNTQTARQIKQEINEADAKASEVQAMIENHARATRGQIIPRFEGDVHEPGSQKAQAHDVKKIVVKALFAAANPDKITAPTGRPPEPTAIGRTILQKLAANIRPDQVTETTAPYLYKIIQKASNGDFENIDGIVSGFKSLEMLKMINPLLYKNLQTALVEAARDRGMSEVEAKTKFEVKSETEEIAETPSEEDERVWDNDWKQYLSNFYKESDDDIFVLKCVYLPKQFPKLLEKVKKEYAIEWNRDKGHPENTDLSHDEEMSKEFRIGYSQAIEQKIITTLMKIYNVVDERRSTKFFSEIAKENPFHGIDITAQILGNRLRQLRLYYENPDHKIDDPALWDFYRDVEREETKEVVKVKTGEKEKNRDGTVRKDADGNEIDKYVDRPVVRYHPIPKPTKIGLPEFFTFIEDKIVSVTEVREFTHDAVAIMHLPVDPKDGYYGRLGGFAEKLHSVDLDEISSLPDSDMIMRAYSIYVKFLREEFASHDWRHHPKQFTRRAGEKETEIELRVRNTLESMSQGEMTVDIEARIKSARNIALGLAKGVTLVEPEMGSCADPVLDENGQATGESYGVADVAPFTPFNPAHWGLRWQNQNNLNLVLFGAVDGPDAKDGVGKPWDHNKIIENHAKYRLSWAKGREGLEGKQLMIDKFMNFAGIGGWGQRKSWRYWGAYKGHLEYINPRIKQYDYLKSWKALEKIGYEVLKDFVDHKQFIGFGGAQEYTIKDEFLLGKTRELVRERNDFFRYLYEQYFVLQTVPPDPAHPRPIRSFDEIMTGLRASAKESLLKNIREKKAAPSNFNEQVEINARRKFMTMALNRVIAQRLPSEIIIYSRRRMTETGWNLWDELCKKCGWPIANNPEAPGSPAEPSPIEQVLKDISIAETMLKEDRVKNVRKSLREDSNRKLYEVADTNTVLTRAKLEAYLRSIKGMTDERCNNALKAYDVIQRDILDDKLLDKYDSSDYKFTYASEEMDWSLMEFRAAGQRILPRAIKDIASIETNVVNGVFIEYWNILHQVSISGKKDFGPLLEAMKKVKKTIEDVHNPEKAAEVNYILITATINYMKEDFRNKPLLGLFGRSRNSLAADYVEKDQAVWKWDAKTIDEFVNILAVEKILPDNLPFNLARPPVYEPFWINLPFINKPIKLPDFIQKRKPDFAYTGRLLRKHYGGQLIKDVFLTDFPLKYGPMALFAIIAFLIWQSLKKNKGSEH